MRGGPWAGGTSVPTRWRAAGSWCRRSHADFLTPTPLGEGEPTFEEEMEAVREAEPADAVPQLEVAVGGPVPEPLRSRRDLPRRMAEVLEWVWRETVLPEWPRRRRIVETDVVARTALLSRGGWAAALDELCPGRLRRLGDGRLQINTRDYPPRSVDGGRLLFVPGDTGQGLVVMGGDGAVRDRLPVRGRSGGRRRPGGARSARRAPRAGPRRDPRTARIARVHQPVGRAHRAPRRGAGPAEAGGALGAVRSDGGRGRSRTGGAGRVRPPPRCSSGRGPGHGTRIGRRKVRPSGP